MYSPGLYEEPYTAKEEWEMLRPLVILLLPIVVLGVTFFSVTIIGAFFFDKFNPDREYALSLKPMITAESNLDIRAGLFELMYKKHTGVAMDFLDESLAKDPPAVVLTYLSRVPCYKRYSSTFRFDYRILLVQCVLEKHVGHKNPKVRRKILEHLCAITTKRKLP